VNGSALSIWLVPAAFLWVGTIVLLSILRRRHIGKPIFPKPPGVALFVERRTSGRNLKTLRGRFGGAKNCLLVVVTETELSVEAMFPFNLMFLPEVYGLDFRISRDTIQHIDTKPSVFGDTIIVQADAEHFELRLRNSMSFKLALETRRP
jgi:hypothetical protein